MLLGISRQFLPYAKPGAASGLIRELSESLIKVREKQWRGSIPASRLPIQRAKQHLKATGPWPRYSRSELIHVGSSVAVRRKPGVAAHCLDCYCCSSPRSNFHDGWAELSLRVSTRAITTVIGGMFLSTPA